MQILLNGHPLRLSAALDLAGLIAQLGLNDRRLAVEVNRMIVPRSQHAGYQLQEGDQVELVQAIGGG